MTTDNSTPTKKRGPGRPSFEPTPAERKQVEALAGYGVPQAKIATLVRDGIDKVTLLKHFRAELDRGIAKADAKISETLFQQAVSGNTSALIFWAKARLGWRETQDINHKSEDGSMTPRDSGAAVLAALQRKHDDPK